MVIVVMMVIMAVPMPMLMTVVVMIASMTPGLVAVAVAVGMLVRCRPVIHGRDATPAARHHRPSCRPPTMTPRNTSWCVM